MTDTKTISRRKTGTVLDAYSTKEVDALKRTVAKGATNEELVIFLENARAYGLNPFLKEIYFLKVQGQFTTITSRDGYYKIARDQPNFLKMKSEVVCKDDEFTMEYKMGELTNFVHKPSAEKKDIIGAWCYVWSKDGKNDTFEYLPFKESKQGNRVWTKHPTLMMRKVAEASALKRFSGITGLVTAEEMPTNSMSTVVEEAEYYQKETGEMPTNTRTVKNNRQKPVEVVQNTKKYVYNTDKEVLEALEKWFNYYYPESRTQEHGHEFFEHFKERINPEVYNEIVSRWDSLFDKEGNLIVEEE